VASAQAKIEVVVKNLRSLDKIEKALTKINSQNDKLIASLDKVVGSLSNIEKAVVGVGKEATNSQKQLAGTTTQTTKLLKGQVSKWYGIKQAVNSILGALGNVGLAAFNFNKEMMKTWQLTMKLQKFKKNLYVDYFAESKAPLSELNKIIGNLRTELNQYHSSQMRLVGGDEEAINVKNQLAGALREQSIEQAKVNNLLREAQGITQLGPGGKGRGFGSRFVNTSEMESAKARDRSIRQRAAETRQARMIADGPYKSGWSPSLSRESQRLIKLDSEFKNLPTVKAVRQLKAIEQKRLLIHKRNLRASEKLNQMAQAQGMVGSTGFTAAQYGPQPAALTMMQRMGFGSGANPKGMFASRGGFGGRMRGAGSSAMIGGMFPLLFGQGGASAAGGGLGGLAGGALGAGLGFGLSLLGTVIGTKIQEAKDFRTEIDKLNISIKSTGGTSTFTAQSIKQFGKDLGLTKDEALQAARSFAQFDAAARVALTKTFGNEEVFNALAALKDNQTTLEAIKSLSTNIGIEKTKETLEILKQKGLLEAQLSLVNEITTAERSRQIQKASKITFADRRNALADEMGVDAQGRSGAQQLRDARVEKLIKDFEIADKKARALLDSTKELNKEFDRMAKLKGPEDELAKLIDPVNQLVSAATAIGDAFSSSFKGIISGSMSAQQALANFFSRTADSFAQMAADILAAQIRAKIVGMFANAFASSFNPASAIGPNADISGAALDAGRSYSDMDKIMNGGLQTVIGAEGGYWSGGLKPFASGGYATKPTLGLVGEAGEDEYIIPASKMASSMQRYSAGARGEAVIPGTGSSHAGGGAEGSTTVNYSGPILNFDSEEFVPKSAVGQIIASAAKQGASMGETRTMKSMQNNRSARARIGM